MTLRMTQLEKANVHTSVHNNVLSLSLGWRAHCTQSPVEASCQSRRAPLVFGPSALSAQGHVRAERLLITHWAGRTRCTEKQTALEEARAGWRGGVNKGRGAAV